MTDGPAAEPPEPGLGALAARGAAVTISAQIVRMIIQVSSVVVLVRLLTPEDYGLLAMVLAIIGVGEIFRDFGLSSAAIQAKVLSRQQRDNLLWVNAGIGVALAGIVYAAAPLIALLFDESELIPIGHALAFVFVLNGLTTQYRADLVRRLRFLHLAAGDVIAPLVGLVTAVILGIAGAGYWALVAQQLIQAAALLAVLATAARWLPGRPRKGEPMRPLMQFGWNLVSTQLVGYLSNNIDTLIIGVRFGPNPLGIYNRGFQLLMTPLNQIRVPLTTVAVPVLARLQEDERRFGQFIVRGQLALGYTLVAGLGLVASAAEPVTALMLGERWLSVAPILRLLAIAGIFQTLALVAYWVYVSRGLTGTLFRYSLVSAAIRVVCVIIGSAGGIVGVAIGYAVAPAISWPISLWWLSRSTPVPTRKLYGGASRILALVVVVGLLAALASSELQQFGSVIQITAALLVTIGGYALASALIPRIRRDAEQVIALYRLVSTSRRRPSDPPASSVS